MSRNRSHTAPFFLEQLAYEMLEILPVHCCEIRFRFVNRFSVTPKARLSSHPQTVSPRVLAIQRKELVLSG